jgi:hypothetical protein
MRWFGGVGRGVAPVIGNVLLVAVVVVVATTLTVLAFGFLEGAGAPTADASFEYERTPAGLRLIPQALGTAATVRLNGQPVATVEPDEAGRGVLLPTAPGDTITVVSTDRENSVLVNREVDSRSEVGDFIAYYTFDRRTDATVVDRSGNGNNGTATTDGERPQRGQDGAGTYMAFDENDGSVDMGDLSVTAPGAEVDEITVALRYRLTGESDQRQELLQHRDNQFAWYLESDDAPGSRHELLHNIGWNSGTSAQTTVDSIPENEVQTAVATYDGETMTLYRNGTKVDSAPLQRSVGLGRLFAAGGSGPQDQYTTGRFYELRLYYTAMSGEEVRVLTRAMEN